MDKSNYQIRMKLQALGITQRQIAAEVGVHEVTLSRWLCRGEVNAMQAQKIDTAIRNIMCGQ